MAASKPPAASMASADEKWGRLQATVHERLDTTANYADTVARVVDTLWTWEQRRDAQAALLDRDARSPFYRILWDDYRMSEHYAQTDSHREFMVRSFDRLGGYLPAVTRRAAEDHDLSKYELVEAVGYTLRWVHGRQGVHWLEALGHHYGVQEHHPQFFIMGKTGLGLMSTDALQESLVDMVACRWERQLEGRQDVTNSELVDIAPGFFDRYQVADRAAVQALIDKIARQE
ncbi:hypothetical protein FJT64_022844 [Amphibalanus amphitrite]|uniref:Uncharacterized protein n=1 Tax=Amphibalanus amphitrite TaxID=1232801 RepID=A0A6A4WTX2_AMPAM|nr:hypothetical protein FJT64_022844 [Amphibalanus amphitrite]